MRSRSTITASLLALAVGATAVLFSCDTHEIDHDLTATHAAKAQPKSPQVPSPVPCPTPIPSGPDPTTPNRQMPGSVPGEGPAPWGEGGRPIHIPPQITR